MQLIDKTNLKVGETTLKSRIEITIPEYGQELPEIASSSPIPLPMYASVANIINWLERDIRVEFCKRSDRERVFFFVMEYNRFAEKANKDIEDPEDQYRLAKKAQENLYRAIDFTNYVETKKDERKIPFKKKPFRGVIKKENEGGISSYFNPYLAEAKKKKDKKGEGKPLPPQINPDDVRAYDLFIPTPEMAGLAPGKTSFDDIDLS